MEKNRQAGSSSGKDSSPTGTETSSGSATSESTRETKRRPGRPRKQTESLGHNLEREKVGEPKSVDVHVPGESVPIPPNKRKPRTKKTVLKVTPEQIENLLTVGNTIATKRVGNLCNLTTEEITLLADTSAPVLSKLSIISENSEEFALIAAVAMVTVPRVLMVLHANKVKKVEQVGKKPIGKTAASDEHTRPSNQEVTADGANGDNSIPSDLIPAVS